MFARLRSSLLESISNTLFRDGAEHRELCSLRSWRAVRGVRWGGRRCLVASDDRFCCWQRISPFAAKGADAGACNMHEAVGQWREEVNTCGAFGIQMLGEGGNASAGCGALSRPPEAVGGVSWWLVDCAKRRQWCWAPAELMSKSTRLHVRARRSINTDIKQLPWANR